MNFNYEYGIGKNYSIEEKNVLCQSFSLFYNGEEQLLSLVSVTWLKQQLPLWLF